VRPAQQFRDMADEARTMASEMTTESSQTALLNIAKQ
jgi:hypothetical protein